jgi:hypothetical protein
MVERKRGAEAGDLGACTQTFRHGVTPEEIADFLRELFVEAERTGLTTDSDGYGCLPSSYVRARAAERGIRRQRMHEAIEDGYIGVNRFPASSYPCTWWWYLDDDERERCGLPPARGQ